MPLFWAFPVSLLALVLGVPAVALLSGAVSLFHESESIVRPPSERKALARKLYGRIQIVDTAGDYRVQVVDAAPDLRVKIVDAFPNSPGEWKLVDTAGDYRVQFVHAFGDIRVKFVDAFPGVEE